MERLAMLTRRASSLLGRPSLLFVFLADPTLQTHPCKRTLAAASLLPAMPPVDPTDHPLLTSQVSAPRPIIILNTDT